MSNITATATFTKLRNGSWGVKGHGLMAGQVAFVAKRDGARKQVRIDKIIWTGEDGTQIASIVATDNHTQSRGQYQRSGYRPVHRQIRNWHCTSCGNEAWDCDC